MLYIDYIETGIPEKIVDIEDLQEYLNLKNYQIKVFKKYMDWQKSEKKRVP